MINRKSFYFVDFLFLFSLLLLIINDHYLKWAYANWITGKLSDVAGLIVLPILLLKLFPVLNKTKVIYGTALFFIFWKSPAATGFINFYNQFSLIPITRVIDFTDLFCLIILWPLYQILPKDFASQNKRNNSPEINWSKCLMLPAIIALMATSPPISFYHRHTRAPIYFNKSLNTNLSKAEVLNRLKANGFNVQKDLAFVEGDSTKLIYIQQSPYYTIEEFIFNGDTLNHISFSIFEKENKSTIYINGLYEDMHFENQKEKRKFRKTKQHTIKQELLKILLDKVE